MFLLLLTLYGYVNSTPVDEFTNILNKGDLSPSGGMPPMLKQLVPSGYAPQKMLLGSFESFPLPHNETYIEILENIGKDRTRASVTFNIYDDEMRKSVIVLFQLLKLSEEKTVDQFLQWASRNLNSHMVDYITRLLVLYDKRFLNKEIMPPFISHPNYFVISETIIKSMMLKINNGLFTPDEGFTNQYEKVDDVIFINTNYSGYKEKYCLSYLDYFMEDVGLNSYYYGLHLLHPFWMHDAELNEYNPRHAEHYYYAHHQLKTRFLFEMYTWNHLNKIIAPACLNMYNPRLIYDNGESFPIRINAHVEVMGLLEERTYVTQMKMALQECISRGIAILENGKTQNISEDTNILAKSIRATVDNEKFAKIVRALYGYSGKLESIDRYNSAPSVLFHPMTSLRDLQYWQLIRQGTKIINDFKNSLKPYNLTEKISDVTIMDASIPDITTYFKNYEFEIDRGSTMTKFEYRKPPTTYAARQRRLAHLPFEIKILIAANKKMDVVVRMFLGQVWVDSIKMDRDSFYELDAFEVNLNEGENSVAWSLSNSSRYSDDYEMSTGNTVKTNKYNMFKFPKTLAIPRGLKKGLNLTLFVIVSPKLNEPTEKEQETNLYRTIMYEYDDKPLGYPFHKKFKDFTAEALHYKIYNITIFHKKKLHDPYNFPDNLY